jgi:hypothetical protein
MGKQLSSPSSGETLMEKTETTETTDSEWITTLETVSGIMIRAIDTKSRSLLLITIPPGSPATIPQQMPAGETPPNGDHEREPSPEPGRKQRR